MYSYVGIQAGRFIVGVHACWTTSREVRRVELRTGRIIELDHERVCESI